MPKNKDTKSEIPDNFELNQLIDAWVIYADHPEYSNRDDYWWATAQVMDYSSPRYGQPEKLWLFIRTAYKRELSDSAFGMLAAGPLEDLLGYWGEKYIDKIETLAKDDKKFNQLIRGVYQHFMSDDLWRRVQRLIVD